MPDMFRQAVAKSVWQLKSLEILFSLLPSFPFLSLFIALGFWS